MSVAIGVDIGGTKTAVRAADAAGHRSVVLPSGPWTELDTSARAAATAAAVRAAHAGPLDDAVVAIGAHGCETTAMCDELGALVAGHLACDVLVVNDAELLVPAAGLEAGIGLIAGTGSIAVGRHALTGEFLSVGGWGWVLGDEGSGSALVREAARAVLHAADAGEVDDPLKDALLASVGVPDLHALALTLSWRGGVEHWGEHAPVVGAAARAGSALAAAVLRDGGDALARLVGYLRARAVAGGDMVVGAGGALVGEPLLRSAVEESLAVHAPGATLVVLDEQPVAGALRLAERRSARRQPRA